MAENNENDEGLSFDLSKKKKKKKPRDDPAGNAKEGDENTPIDSQSKENKSKTVAFADENREETAKQPQAAGAGDDDDDESDVLKGKKKKKSKVRVETTTEISEAANQDETVTRTVADETTTDASHQIEHTYYELLSRVFSIIQEKNPSAGDDRDRIKLIIKPPQVARVGTKRTSFSNFGEICKSLKRPEKHLQQYVLAELGTNGSIDANAAMIIKGRFQQKQMESVLRSYIKEYVICKTCRSADTVLQKEERLTVLLCNTCRSRYFVTGIKTGFQAQVGKRAATRAKAT